MCCGTAQNSYRTLAGLCVVLADGSLLDTEDTLSVEAFRQSHAELLSELEQLGVATRDDEELAARIRHKYKIKNTTGYSLNALVDFEDPIEILAHLMIGSEGTLGFLSRITLRTVVEDPCKASALVFFPTIETACQAVIRLKLQPVSAVELLDRSALRSVEDKPGLPSIMRTLSDEATALLIEVRAENATLLEQRMNAALGALTGIATIEPASFSTDPDTCEIYWKVRKGAFPSVGAMRRAGTTVIIEDVAFPVESLAAATLDLQALLRHHGYSEGIIFGHALEGNLHFVFTQDFSDAAEVDRYARFMEDICRLVVDKYDGSLKAEHGTGRNMAPFVEMEWGQQATALMRRIKTLLDPDNLLNPGGRRDRRPLYGMRLLRNHVSFAWAHPLAAPAHRQLARTVASHRRRRRRLRTRSRFCLRQPRHLRRMRPLFHCLPGRHQHRRPDSPSAWAQPGCCIAPYRRVGSWKLRQGRHRSACGPCHRPRRRQRGGRRHARPPLVRRMEAWNAARRHSACSI
jgi:D-lactate dehydrogenase